MGGQFEGGRKERKKRKENQKEKKKERRIREEEGNWTSVVQWSDPDKLGWNYATRGRCFPTSVLFYA